MHEINDDFLQAETRLNYVSQMRHVQNLGKDSGLISIYIYKRRLIIRCNFFELFIRMLKQAKQCFCHVLIIFMLKSRNEMFTRPL